MFKLNLKIALRNLYRNRTYTLINILGLSVGMTSCILIFLFIKFQTGFDTHFKNADRVYRFVTNWKYTGFDDYSSGVALPFAAAAREELPGIERIARVSRRDGVVTAENDEGRPRFKASRDVYFVEPELFDILQVEWLEGTSGQSLSEPNTAVITEKTAVLLFGSVKLAVGKTFTFWNSMPLRVVGVIADLPASTSVPIEIAASYASFYGNKDQQWRNVSSWDQCYMLLKEGVSLSAFEHALDAFNEKYINLKKLPGKQHNRLQPLLDIHFSERYSNFADTSISKKEVYGLGIIGLFLIVAACINFINLATAQSVNRAKEVGLRKVMGAVRRQLIFQFLAETAVITIVSLIIACIFSELSLPLLSQLFKGPVSLTLFSDPVIFLFLLVLVAAVSFMAGFYPAMILSRFSPALAIKNKVRLQTGSLSFRMVLIIVQFTVTIVLLIATVVVIRQMEYVREKPLGFEKDHVMLINFPGDSISLSHQQLIREKIMHVRGVEMQSYFARPPLSEMVNTTSFYVDGRENKDFEVRLNMADEHYFDLFGLKFLAGKVYGKSDTANAIIANETFVRRLGIVDPRLALGKIISQNGRKGPIVGVVKDFNDLSLRDKISPMVFYQEKTQFYNMGVKLNSQHLVSARKEIESIWTNSFPNEVYTGKFIDDDIEAYYEAEQITGILFKLFGGVIMFIAFIGLFGLISFVAAQRTREMAIRRVLGATTVEMVKMLNGSFVKMVLVANLIAWPLSYILTNQWLSGFAYRMAFSIWPFLLAMLASMLITVIVVGFRSYQAATASPVTALKYE